MLSRGPGAAGYERVAVRSPSPRLDAPRLAEPHQGLHRRSGAVLVPVVSAGDGATAVELVEPD